MIKWSHDELAYDLAIAKGGIPYLNVCLGSTWTTNGKKVPRADLLVCRPSYKRFCISIYEVKVSRADYQSDIRSEKWKSYLPFCHRFYFAVQSGIINKSEIPSGAGLMVRGNKRWGTPIAAKVMNHDIPENTMMALIFAKQRRSRREKRLDDVMSMADVYGRRDYFGRLKAARVLGNEFGKLHEAAMRFGNLNRAIEVLNAKREELWRS